MPSTVPAADPVRLLQDLIRCASVTPAEAGVLDVLDRALTPLGFAVTRLRFEGNGSYPVDNLFATRGTIGPHLLFNGHTDVVPPGDRSLWTHEPFGAEIAGDLLYGRGAVDMKSGIAAFIAALAEAPRTGRISLAITNDEEADGVNGTARILEWAAAQGHRFDFAIVGEPSATARVGDSIKIGRRGSYNGKITVTGVQGHVAYPRQALNPLPVAAAIVTALSGKLDDGSEHFPPSNLEFTSIDVGNTVTNVIPAMATLRFRLKDAAVKIVEKPFKAGGKTVPAGSFLVDGAAYATLKPAVEQLGLEASQRPISEPKIAEPERPAFRRPEHAPAGLEKASEDRCSDAKSARSYG